MRDLLVYLDDTPASPPRLEAALALAGRLGARLTALCLVAEPYLRGAGGRHLPAELVREHLAHAEAEAVLAERVTGPKWGSLRASSWPDGGR